MFQDRPSELVVELEVFKKGVNWYRKGLDIHGNETWEIMDDQEEVYGDNWIDEVIQDVRSLTE